MNVRKISWLLAVPLALGACRTSSAERTAEAAPPPVVPAPGASVPPSATEDANPKRSVAQGGVKTAPYVAVGIVEEVEGESVLIRTEYGRSTLVYVRDDTEIVMDGARATVADLREGQRVRAAYDPAHFAERIEIGTMAETPAATPAPAPEPTR